MLRACMVRDGSQRRLAKLNTWLVAPLPWARDCRLQRDQQPLSFLCVFINPLQSDQRFADRVLAVLSRIGDAILPPARELGRRDLLS
jgi:hypothetical protein